MDSPELQQPIIPNTPITRNVAMDLAKANYASAFAQILLQKIQEFDTNLGEDFEVGVKLVSFGQAVIIAVHGIGFQDPSIIIFIGIGEDGSPLELIQHVTQISFLLTALPRQKKEEPKQLIGFRDYHNVID
ncbi:MAG: DUF6173 family protein [Ruminiclostridium sp.]